MRCHLATAESNAACATAERGGPIFCSVMLNDDATPDAPKVAGLPAIPLPVTVAVSVLEAGAAPKVQPPICAMPLVFVLTLPPLALPLPPVTANVTAALFTGRPPASVTFTAGRMLTG